MSKSKPAPKASPVSAEPRHPFTSREEALAAGKTLRAQVPIALHATWRPSDAARDPVAILEESNRDGRMLKSPFTFLRGSAGKP